MRTRVAVPAVLGICAALIVTLFLLARSPSRACPAIGYAYQGDVELVFPQEPEAVSACFGEGCSPAPVAKASEGTWRVPQAQPYLMPPVSVTSIRVEAIGPSGVRVSQDLPIESEPTGEYPYGRECGGPVRFTPVHVPLA